MIHTAILGLAALLNAALPTSRVLQFGEFEVDGLAWETGGIATSEPGDRLELVGTMTYADGFWGVDLVTNELTVRLTDLVVESQSNQGGWRYVVYSQGRIEMWLDPSRDNDYGVDPPNATSPSSFANGEVFLAGEIHAFTVGYFTATQMGSLFGIVMFSSGSAIGLANQWMQNWGWPMLSGSVVVD